MRCKVYMIKKPSPRLNREMQTYNLLGKAVVDGCSLADVVRSGFNVVVGCGLSVVTPGGWGTTVVGGGCGPAVVCGCG